MTPLRRMFLRVSAVALASVVTLASHAVPVTFNFGGTITAVTFGTAPAGVGPGTTFNGSYTFASDAVDSNGASTVADYSSSGAPYGLTVDIGGYVFSATNVLVEIANNDSGRDQYYVSSGGPAAPGHYLLNLNLNDPTQTAFGGTALPLSPPDVTAFATRIFDMVEYPNGPGDALFALRGIVTSIALPAQAVTEPATILLLGAGLVAAGLARRRGSRSTNR